MSAIIEQLLGKHDVQESKGFQPWGTIFVNGLFPSSPDTMWNVQAARWTAANTCCDAASFWSREGLLRLGHGGHVRVLSDLLLKEHKKSPHGKQDAIGHSNGCSTLVDALLQIDHEVYQDDGFIPTPEDDSVYFLDDLWLIAPYLHPDATKHLNILLEDFMVRRIFVLVSRNDGTVGWSWFRQRTMGRDGPRNTGPDGQVGHIEYRRQDLPDPRAIKGRLIVIRDDTMQHNQWVNPQTAEDGKVGFNQSTFAMIRTISSPAATPVKATPTTP